MISAHLKNHPTYPMVEAIQSGKQAVKANNIIFTEFNLKTDKDVKLLYDSVDVAVERNKKKPPKPWKLYVVK